MNSDNLDNSEFNNSSIIEKDTSQILESEGRFDEEIDATNQLMKQKQQKQKHIRPRQFQQIPESLEIEENQNQNQNEQNNNNIDYSQLYRHSKKHFLKNKNTVKSIGALLMLFIALMAHNGMYGSCPYSDNQCMQFIEVHLKHWIVTVIFTSTLLVGVFLLSWYKKIDRIFMLLSNLLSIYIIFFKLDTQWNHISLKFYEPGQAVGVLIQNIVYMLSWISYRILRILYLRHKKVLLGLILTAIAGVCFYIHFVVTSCDGWEQGITGEIDFEGPYCQINKPKYCWPRVADNMFNFGPKTCDMNPKSLDKKKKKTLLAYDIINFMQKKDEIKKVMEEVNYLAWPLSTSLMPEERTYLNVQESIINKTVVVDSIEQGFKDKNAEVVIDLNKQEVNIQVQRNETLVEERKEYNKEHQIDSLAQNIIIVYIDALSRPQAHRKMPLTQDFLRRHHILNRKEKIHEFYRFHSIDKKTLNNAMTLHYNTKFYEDDLENMEEFSEDEKQVNLIKELKDAGYIVGHATNTCTSQCIFRERYAHLKKYFEEEIGDHEFLFYDPTYMNKQNYFDLWQGPNSLKRRCVYGNDSNKYLLDYGREFLKTYENEKKTLFFEFTDAHEPTSEIIQYLDENLSQFLEGIEEDGVFLQDTAVYFLADHGQHLLQAFYINEKSPEKVEKLGDRLKYEDGVWQNERMLPLFQMMMSESMYEKIPDENKAEAQKNEQIIFGMQQARNTLLSTAYGFSNEKYQNDVFRPMEESNSCYDIGMTLGLDPSLFCICRPQK